MTVNACLLDGLRPYQRDAINASYSYMAENPGKNPCIVMPTGSGKSWVIAGICENLMRRAPDCRILVLSHRKELLEQDADKILKAWPAGYNRVGLYCAGLGRHDINQITVASVQSIARNLDNLTGEESKIALTIVDEAHMIGKGNSTKQYRDVLNRVHELNPDTRVIGLTATPYRLGQGRLDEGKDALFSTCIEPVSIDELIKMGCLAPLRSKFTEMQIDLKGVRRQSGDYQLNDLEARIDTNEVNARIVSEAIERGADRRAWLFFCVSRKHAHNMCEELIQRGIHAKVLLGDTPRDERANLLEQFRSGELQALTSVGVLTTGFDAPIIDMLVMARPTLSPGLYVQMAGRGMRPSPETGKTDCIMLDFAGVVTQHGPITRVTGPKLKTKHCPKCKEIVYADEKICPACGAILQPPRTPDDIAYVCKICGSPYTLKELSDKLDFSEPETFHCLVCGAPITLDEKLKQAILLYRESKSSRRGPSGIRFNDDVMGESEPVRTMSVASWQWTALKTKKGDPVLLVRYYPEDAISDVVEEWLNVCNENGWARQRSRKILFDLAKGGGVYDELCRVFPDDDMIEIGHLFTATRVFEKSTPPLSIEYIIKNGYPKITKCDWRGSAESPVAS